MINFHEIAMIIHSNLRDFLLVRKVDVRQLLYRGLYERYCYEMSEKPVFVRAIYRNKSLNLITIRVMATLYNAVPRKGDMIFLDHHMSPLLIQAEPIASVKMVAQKATDRIYTLLVREGLIPR